MRTFGGTANSKGPKDGFSCLTLHFMVSIGDVMSVVAFLLGVGGTAWAMTVTMGLLFPEATEQASLSMKGAFVRGLLPLLFGFFGVVMLGIPNPAVKLFGWVALLAVLALAALGLAGLSRVAGQRLRTLQPDMGPYPAFLRGAGFLVSASLFPLLGWFLFAPAAFIVSLGAGWTGFARRHAAIVEA